MKNLELYKYLPHQKPPLGSVLDVTHPLAVNLGLGVLLNEKAGTTLRNIVPGRPNFTTVGNPGWSSESNSLRFIASSSQYAVLSKGPNLANSAFSITLRFKPIGLGGNTALVSVGDANSVDQQIHIRPLTTTSILFGQFSDDLTVTVPSSITTDITKDYHTVTVTLSKAKLQSLYFDGQLLGTRTAGSFFTGNTNYYFARFVAGGGVNLDCNISHLYVHTYDLPLNLVQWLHSEPYDLITTTPTLRTFVQLPILNRSVSQQITFTQIPLAINFPTVHQNLNLNQTLAHTINHVEQDLNQSILISQNVALQHTNNRIVFNKLVLQTSTRAYKLFNLSLTQTISLSQIVRRGPNLSKSQSITLLQSTPIKTIIHNPSILQQLVLNQVITKNSLSNLLVNQSILLQSIRNTNLPFNGNLINITYPGLSVYHSSRCLVILQTKISSIVLPCPIFDDSQNLTQLLTIKRAMTGTKRVYIKPNSRNKILYTFRMDRQKSLEFRQFYVDNFVKSINQITMTNFKGETWIGYIVIDPTFVKKARWANCGEEINVAFEFEGYKVNG